MKSYHAIQIAILCFIWSNVTTSKLVAFGAALNGLIYIVLAASLQYKKQ